MHLRSHPAFLRSVLPVLLLEGLTLEGDLASRAACSFSLGCLHIFRHQMLALPPQIPLSCGQIPALFFDHYFVLQVNLCRGALRGHVQYRPVFRALLMSGSKAIDTWVQTG